MNSNVGTKSNPWRDHLESYCKTHGVTLKQAMTESRPTYKPGQNGGGPSQEEWDEYQAEQERKKNAWCTIL